MVRYLVREAGITQFLEIGTGIPVQDSVHEVAAATLDFSRPTAVSLFGILHFFADADDPRGLDLVEPGVVQASRISSPRRVIRGNVAAAPLTSNKNQKTFLSERTVVSVLPYGYPAHAMATAAHASVPAARCELERRDWMRIWRQVALSV